MGELVELEREHRWVASLSLGETTVRWHCAQCFLTTRYPREHAGRSCDPRRYEWEI